MNNSANPLQSLFARYEAQDAAWEAKKTETETAFQARSDAVKAIADAVAPEKQVTYKGVKMSIVVRGTTYFLRTANEHRRPRAK